VGGMIHHLNSLKCAIGAVLSELDRLAPIDDQPPTQTKTGKHPVTAPKKGGNT